MILLNFSHPITDAQLAQIENLTGNAITQIHDIPTQFDNTLSFPAQVCKLVSTLPLSPQDWQVLPILINPPGFNFAAVTLLAELHGRMGHFPSILRIRPEKDTTPQRYVIAEIINLQKIRETARSNR